MIDLSDRVILVTGASRGIGAATALTLSQAGAFVIVHYGHDRDAAETLADEIGRDRCHVVAADLSIPQAAVDLWQQAVSWRGHLDVLVNNAATMPHASIEDEWEVWSQAWQTTLQVNLTAVADLCRMAIHHFKTRQGGIIINVASRAAFRGDAPDFMHYAASKGGVVALTRSIARGFAQDGVLAYAIAPGFVRTERIEQAIEQWGIERVTGDIPLGQAVPPQEVANVIAFLASGLATHATGTTIDINGASYVR